MVFCRQGLSAHRPLLSCRVDRPRGLVASLRLQGTLPRGRVLGAVGCQELLKAPPSRPAGGARATASWFTDAAGWGGAFCLCLSVYHRYVSVYTDTMCVSHTSRICIMSRYCVCAYVRRIYYMRIHILCACMCTCAYKKENRREGLLKAG